MQIGKEILKKAIKIHGEQKQVDMMIEEASELIKALLKYRRAIYTKDNALIKIAHEDVIDEIADVSIMNEQMILIFDNDELVQDKIKYKLERLNSRLNNK